QVRPRSSSVGVYVVADDAERNTGLEGGNSRDLPASDYGIGGAIEIGADGFPSPDRQVIDVIDDRALRCIAGIDALLRGQVVVIRRRVVADISPALRALCIVNEL